MNKKIKINGMILAAGFGTRLRKELGEVPKPLAKLGDKTSIIDCCLDNFRKGNIFNIAVNLHYKSETIKKYLKERQKKFNFHFLFEQEILGTGGGIKNGSDFLKSADYSVVSNSDILYYFDFNKLIKKHIESNAEVSLLVFKNNDSRGVRYNKNNMLTGFSGELKKPLYGLDNYINKDDFLGTFTGIHIFSKSFFDKIYFENKPKFFSIIDVYVEMIKNKEFINVISVDNLYWNDIGTPNNFKKGKIDFKSFQAIEKLEKCKIKEVNLAFKGASDKTVYKVCLENGKSLISITLNNRKELKAIYEFSKFLNNANINVPNVFKLSENFLISENGGSETLLQFIEKKGNLSEKFYKLAIDEILKLKKINYEKFPFEYCFQTDEFNVENVIFDLEYFNNWYLNSKLKKEVIEKIGIEIYNVLKKAKLSVMHRDFQSTNILIKNGEKIYIVDIQTMRKGFSEYDLASLLFDSYIPFDVKFIEKMLDYYKVNEKLDEFVFYNAALIRLLQNIGAFSKFKDREFFKNKIKKCKLRLNYILTEKKEFFSNYILKISTLIQ